MDAAERDLLAQTLRKTMSTTTGAALDAALAELGWLDLLAELPEVAIPLTFELLGETGAVASVVNDVVLAPGDRGTGAAPPLPYAGGNWVVWQRSGGPSAGLDPELPLRPVPAGDALGPTELAAGHRALGWWLVGSGRAMLTLARDHALTRTQFGRPVASFQAVRHRLAETRVALDGAEATLLVAEDAFGSLLAKAAAGHAARTAARHSQQVLGGIGFTAEHRLHQHVQRALVLDGLLGSSKQLTRQAGALLRQQRTAPRLAQL